MERGWVIEPMQLEHIPDVVAVQRLCFPAPFPEANLWRPEHLEAHIGTFPEGQFVVKARQVVGSSSSILVSRSRWENHENWDDLTGGLSMNSHEPEGTVLYGADLGVHPKYRGRGMARGLYEARFALVRKMGLEMFATECRMPDFQASGATSIADYAQGVADGQRVDRTMTPFLRLGMKFVGIKEDAMNDPESGHAAAKLEWRL